MLQRVRDLAVQYNNGTLSTADRASITAEVAQLCAQIASIGNDTKFNGTPLLSGVSTLTFQVGPNDGQTVAVSGVALFGAGLQIEPGIFTFGSLVTIASIDEAIANVASVRGTFGAVQNRMEHTIANLAIYQENLQASESRIRDVDMAAETVTLTKYQILQQAGTAMLAQANVTPQAVLQLLQ